MHKITVSDFYKQTTLPVLFDARTPAEYAKGHIPEALNLPLFSNEERVIVGTLYKQNSPEVAFIKGLDFAGARLASYVTEAIRLAPARKVAVHCWRGGKRSSSLVWLLGMAGFEVQVLTGGYKNYRKFVREQFVNLKLPLVVLGGKTGSSKTEILHQLQTLGEQIIDLEALAQHKGSAFGALGETAQPSVEQFENNLYQVLRNLDLNRRIWVESESRLIGKVYLPDGFWQQHELAPFLRLEVSDEYRIQHLVATYAQFPKADLAATFQKIKKRLGGLRLKQALAALEQDDFATAARIALEYYDQTYHRSRGKINPSKNFEWQTEQTNTIEIAKQLIQFANERSI